MKVMITGANKKVVMIIDADEILKLSDFLQKLVDRLGGGIGNGAKWEYMDQDFEDWVDLDDLPAIKSIKVIKIRVLQHREHQVLSLSFSFFLVYCLTSLYRVESDTGARSTEHNEAPAKENNQAGKYPHQQQPIFLA